MTAYYLTHTHGRAVIFSRRAEAVAHSSTGELIRLKRLRPLLQWFKKVSPGYWEAHSPHSGKAEMACL